MKFKRLKPNRTDPNWRKKMHQLILMSASVHGMGMALSDLMINDMAFPFLRKKPLQLKKDASDATLRIINKLPSDAMGNTIRNESAMLRKKLVSREPDFPFELIRLSFLPEVLQFLLTQLHAAPLSLTAPQPAPTHRGGERGCQKRHAVLTKSEVAERPGLIAEKRKKFL